MAQTASQDRDKDLSLVAHLAEFRDRLMVASIAVVLTTLIAFIFSVDIIRLLMIPVNCSFLHVDPALLPNERRFIRLSGVPILALFVLGMAFCYFVLLPNAIKFLINFGGDVIENQLRASDYISFVTTFILGVGLVFEVPVIIYTLVRIGVEQRSWR